MEDSVGFEPTDPFEANSFQDCRNRPDSANYPDKVTILYLIKWCLEQDLNLYSETGIRA